MTLLLPDTSWATRLHAAEGPLAPLAAALATDLEPLVAAVAAGTLHVPSEKALLSRVGGRCPLDGELLEFDPWSPHAHRCPRCSAIHRDVWHDRFWPYWYQLWLAERALHAALLARLLDTAHHRSLAITLLDVYADRYLEYPNRDNVLGPSRPFFSTYLESIWLLQLTVALDLLESDAAPGDGLARLSGRVRDRILEPSIILIASYDEGLSNRQVWNNAALLAARVVLGRDDAIARAMHDRHGVLTHLEKALLPDGTWYEGENYHLFAHRGLWYAVTMLEVLGVEIPGALRDRFDAGFVAPFLTAMPDFTLPSRRDSQYAISLRQPRFAELCELGLSRRRDPILLASLSTIYDERAPTGDTGRARTTADVERNGPAVRLSRADLGWRSLLHALPDLPDDRGADPGSVLLDSQGIAIFRRDGGQRWIAFDYGHSGGGHGHPDRLNLLHAEGDTRWLDDMGTGSYVDPSLHWYRSSLAHNAPLVDGRSQRRIHGTLLGHEERGAAGWASAEAGIALGVSMTRTVVVMPDYLLDLVEWHADRDVTIDLPFHVDGDSDGATWVAAPLRGGGGVEDGFAFLRETERAAGMSGVIVHRARSGGGAETYNLRVVTPSGAEWWRAHAPGPPGRRERRFHLVRTRGAEGRIVCLWSRADMHVAVEGEQPAVVVRGADGGEHRHAPAEWGWHIDLVAACARSSIDLLGRVVPKREDAAPTPRASVREAVVLRPGRFDPDAALPPPIGFRASLGEAQYVRSEESWHEAGRPMATVALAWSPPRLVVEIDVQKSGPLCFIAAGTENPYDNEPVEVNGDGVQLYLIADTRAGGWLIVPEPGGGARVRSVDGWPGLVAPDVRWHETTSGYSMRAQVVMPPNADTVALDVIVNETVPGRQRRRGQLVMSGGGGFVYLRGDRHDPARLLPFVLSPH